MELRCYRNEIERPAGDSQRIKITVVRLPWIPFTNI